jgi:hypothetical protein
MQKYGFFTEKHLRNLTFWVYLRVMNRFTLMCWIWLIFPVSFASARESYNDWKYRKSLSVFNREYQALSDYQVAVELSTDTLIAQGKLKPDLGDIRIVDENFLPLCHWVETQGKQVKIWFRIPYLPARRHTDVYLLYGNSAALSFEDPQCTFMMFDDFNGSSVDKNKWELRGRGEPELKEGKAVFSAGENDQFIVSREEYARPLIIEMKVDQTSGAYSSLSMLFRSSYGYIAGYSMSYSRTNRLMQLYKVQPSVCGAFELSYPHSPHQRSEDAEGVWSFSFLSFNEVMAQWPGGDIIEGNTDAESFRIRTGLGVLTCGEKQKGSITVDWVRIRRFSINPPILTPGEEYVNDGILPSQPGSGFIARS